jgi:hypothetical protein
MESGGARRTAAILVAAAVLAGAPAAPAAKKKSTLDQLFKRSAVLGHAKRVNLEMRFAEPLGKGDAEVVFRFDREMGNLAEDFVLVSWPGGSERVPANGKQLTLKIPADASAPKTVFVGGDTLLFRALRGEATFFMTDPCAMWNVESRRISTNLSETFRTTCVVGACPPGTQESQWSPLDRDERCKLPGDDKSRLCVPPGHLRFEALAPAKVEVVFGIGVEEEIEPYVLKAGGKTKDIEALWTRCSRTAFEIGKKRVFPVVGFGETWTIRVGRDGQVNATVTE